MRLYFFSEFAYELNTSYKFNEMLLIKQLQSCLIVQSDSIRANVFV